MIRFFLSNIFSSIFFFKKDVPGKKVVEKNFDRKNIFWPKMFFDRKNKVNKVIHFFFRSKIFSIKKYFFDQNMFRPLFFFGTSFLIFFFRRKNFRQTIFGSPIPIPNFPKIPKIILRTACDRSKYTKNTHGENVSDFPPILT